MPIFILIDMRIQLSTINILTFENGVLYKYSSNSTIFINFGLIVQVVYISHYINIVENKINHNG